MQLDEEICSLTQLKQRLEDLKGQGKTHRTESTLNAESSQTGYKYDEYEAVLDLFKLLSSHIFNDGNRRGRLLNG